MRAQYRQEAIDAGLLTVPNTKASDDNYYHSAQRDLLLMATFHRLRSCNNPECASWNTSTAEY